MLREGDYHIQRDGRIELKFGDADAMLKALDQIVKNEGAIRARYSHKVRNGLPKIFGNGADECLITVKGAEAASTYAAGQTFLGSDLCSQSIWR